MNKKTKQAGLEGEGSYSGTRRYNAGLADHVRRANVSGLAKKAAAALDGAEGPALRRAEKSAKAGPRRGRARRAVRGASAQR